MTHLTSGAVVAAVVSLCAGGILTAQVISTSQIKGTVQDSSGAAIAGADVKVTQMDTGATRTLRSEADGGYLFTALPVGPYRLEVTKEGFSKSIQDGIVLQVNTNPTIDVVMKVGAVTESVAVEAGAAMVETQNSSVGQVVNTQSIVELPLNGRTATDLMYLTPGVQPGRFVRTSYPRSTSVSVAGGIAGSVSYWLDGGTHNDPLSNQNLPLPFPDALQEFKVETSALPAQYGYHSSGSVNAVTKSGGNAVHGDLFEFVRNYTFNARNSFQPVRDNQKRNQFGGTFGGPIQKDKLFYFLGYQGTLTRAAFPTTNFVPTAAMYNGDFSQCPTFKFNAGFSANVPSSAISPFALKLRQYLPTSNNPCGQVTFNSPGNYNEHQSVGKVDYQMSPKHSLFARYMFSQYDQPAGDPNANVLIASILGASDLAQSFTLGDTYLISPTIVNSFRATMVRTSNQIFGNSYFNFTDLGVNNFYQYPVNGAKFVSHLTVGTNFDIATNPAPQPYQALGLNNDLSITAGSHQLSLGISYTNLRSFAISDINTAGVLTFSGVISGVPVADLLLGLPASFSQSAPTYSSQRQNVFGLYAQDAWKLNRRLTVSLGVRWDPYFGHGDHFDLGTGFSMANFLSNTPSAKYPKMPPGIVYAGDPGGPPEGKLTANKLLEFSPRVGIVWDPKGDGRMSIRAGYGYFYEFPNFAFDQFGFNQPFGGTAPNTTPTLTNFWSGSVFNGVSPFPGSIGSRSNAVLQPGLSWSAYPQDVKPTTVQQYNLTVQRQFGQSWLVSAGFVGNTTTHLWVGNTTDPGVFIPGNCVAGQYGLTAPGPCSPTNNSNLLFRRSLTLLNPTVGRFIGGLTVLDEGGTGSYQGMLLSAQRRFAHNFASTTNFTWSHCISDPYATLFGTTAPEIPTNRHNDHGGCPGADIRDVFNQTFLYASPKFSERVTRWLLSDWKTSISLNIRTGMNLTVTTGQDRALNGAVANQRPNLVLSDAYLPNRGQNGWLNKAAFAQPDFGTYGNLGIGNILGPSAVSLNLALSRVFPITEKQQLEIRGEAFNLPNLVNLYNPATALTAPNFGLPAPPSNNLNTGVAPPSPANDPRIMQFALKYVF